MRQFRAALYVRRSKEEHQAASIEVQTGEGTRYIDGRGWTLAPEHIFVDADHGRAEFKKRPALIAMLNAAERGDFDVVVVRDESRLGGDTNRTSLFISDLLDAGCRLFYYFTDEEVTIDGAVDKFMINVRNFASELEREKISQRTHEHLMTKARRGLNVGGRVYGYDNVEVKEGDRRVRVEYRINPVEAEIVREIFRRYATGEGLRAIAKDLNQRHVPPPTVGRRGTRSWAHTTVHAMLRRERYIGQIVWGRKEKTYKGGTRVTVSRDASEWTRVDAPALRIVDEDVWQAVQARNAAQSRETPWLRRGRAPSYLLSGVGRCGVCGGPMNALNAKVSYENVRVYGCLWHRDRGNAVCTNGLRRPVAGIDGAVLGWIHTNVLSEGVIVEALAQFRRRTTEHAVTADTEAPKLEAEMRAVRAEIDRLGQALLGSDRAPDVVVRMINEREGRLRGLEARVTTIRSAPALLDRETRQMEKEALRRLEDLSTLFATAPDAGRAALLTLLGGPLRFTPVELAEGMRYRVEGVIAMERVLLAEDPFHTVRVPSGIRSRRIAYGSRHFPHGSRWQARREHRNADT